MSEIESRFRAGLCTQELTLMVICCASLISTAEAAGPAVITTELRSHGAPDNVGTGQINTPPFTTIPNLRSNDYADIAAGHSVNVTVVNGVLNFDSGPPSRLINGFWPTSADDPGNNVFFQNFSDGMILFDLNGSVSVTEVNTYSRHTFDRTPQKYALYGSNNLQPPSTIGDLTTNGWQRIADVNMRDQFASFNGVAGANIRNSQGSLGAYHFLLFNVHGVGSDGGLGTFYSEIDVVGTLVPEPGCVALSMIALLALGVIRIRLRPGRHFYFG